MEQREWPKDPRFVNHQARGTHQRLLDGLIEAWTQTLTTREVLESMDKHGVPAGLIYRAPDMLEDPHFKARQAIVTTQHPYFGDLKMQNVAPKLSESPGGIRSAAPTALGEHNDEIYSRILGYTAERLAALRAAKVI
jgi:crotonobetainyl-CoA:carnitine CoA-transferase CaiB-like acyl-CoA transferase